MAAMTGRAAALSFMVERPVGAKKQPLLISFEQKFLRP
jgi:hypothetical protein